MIVHVLNSSKVSGVESATLPNLVALRPRVATVFLLEERCGRTGRRGRDLAEALGLPVHEVLVRSRLDPRAVGALARCLERLSPAIVHAHDVKASTYTLAAARLGRVGAALFSTHHGVHGRPDARTRVYERFYAHLVLPRYDRVLAVSRSDARDLAPIVGERLRLHPNGVDARHVRPEEREAAARAARAAWPLPAAARAEDTPLLGVVARLSREKRHDRILAVAAALAGRHPRARWHLVCFGAGPLEGELLRATAALGLEGRVTWAGYRPRVGDEMAGFDVLLSLSDAEGLPLNLIEAGWAGTAVFATRVGGIVDLVDGLSSRAPAGVLVEPAEPAWAMADRLVALVADAPRRRALGAALQERVVERFSRRAWLERLTELYAPYLHS